jgi:hypothetical protein
MQLATRVTPAHVGATEQTTIFDPDAPSAKSMPRQHYGLDFYGVHKGEILVIIDLFSREVIIEHVSSRSQLHVATVLFKHVILSRGVLISFAQN